MPGTGPWIQIPEGGRLSITSCVKYFGCSGIGPLGQILDAFLQNVASTPAIICGKIITYFNTVFNLLPMRPGSLQIER